MHILDVAVCRAAGRAREPDRHDARGDPMTRTRNILLFVLVIFIVYSILTSPTRSADVANTLWDGMIDGLRAIGTFFNALIDS
jgi:hypothetical protein